MPVDSPPAPRHQRILEILNEVVLPALENHTTRAIPESGSQVPVPGGFQEVFPYGIQRHRLFEWMWLSGNWAHIKLRETVYLMQPGDFCLIAPGVLHAEVYTADTPPHQSLWCAYVAEPAAIHLNLFDYDSFGHGTILASLVVNVSSFVGTLLSELHIEMEEGRHRSSEVCHALQLLLATLLVRAVETKGDLETDSTLLKYSSLRVLDYLQRHYMEEVSLDELAKTVHLSRNYLTTVFKQDTGKTISQALTEIRLKQAKILLMEQRRTVREVSRAVGFRSPEHFCRVFQRYEKVSPSQYGR